MNFCLVTSPFSQTKNLGKSPTDMSITGSAEMLKARRKCPTFD